VGVFLVRSLMPWELQHKIFVEIFVCCTPCLSCRGEAL
jgi:hypothetical protein